MDFSFYKGKKVLVTGHTGFKGSWLCELLLREGAEVTGYALEPNTEPALFKLLRLDERMNSVIGDIRDFEKLRAVFEEVSPEIVFHLAAQPIVRESYKEPRYTYDTNVMGTVNVLECVRLSSTVKSVLNVTTDKVYENKEFERGYVEEDVLDGYDPYSNSKSCSELVTHSYKKAFLDGAGIAVSTARAGNVIGGGDFAKDRLIPDCVRAAIKGEDIIIRNPHSVRPFQHVLEPLCVYMLIAEKQYADSEYSGYYNVGPDEKDCLSAGEVATHFCDMWQGASWKDVSEKNAPHEAGLLRLDCTKVKSTFNWKPRWDVYEAINKTIEWSVRYTEGCDVRDVTKEQIEQFHL